MLLPNFHSPIVHTDAILAQVRKINLRLSDDLYAGVQERAQQLGLSMNAYVSQLLSEQATRPPVGYLAATGSAPDMGEPVRGGGPSDRWHPNRPPGRIAQGERGTKPDHCDHQPYAEMGRSFCYRCGARI